MIYYISKVSSRSFINYRDFKRFKRLQLVPRTKQYIDGIQSVKKAMYL